MGPEANSSGGAAFTAMMGALRARRPPATPVPTDAVYVRALTMASVSSSFDPHEMRERLAAEGAPKAIEALKRECMTVLRGDHMLWLLRAEPRMSHLRALAAEGSLRRSIRECRIGADDDLAQSLEAYVEGRGKPIELQTSDELACTERVVTWLSGLVDHLPDLDAVKAAASYQDLLRPMRQLAGPAAHYSGRTAELGKLRDFLGVPAQEGAAGWLKRSIKAYRIAHPTGVFAVTGVGGAGKSAIVSKLILDLIDGARLHRHPFAYLDFDRASLSPDDAAGLVLEMLRQIACQAPGQKHQLDSTINELEEIYVASRSDTVEETTGFASAGHSVAVNSADPRLPPLVRALSTALTSPTAPFLLILDTFEEAEHRSSLGMGRMREMLDVLREVLPALRVIIVGRSIPAQIEVDDQIALNELDPASATAYLQARGLAPKLATAVARQVGGLPLALRLAVKVIEEEGHVITGVPDIVQTTWLWRKIDQKQVLGQLYDRILGHIHDNDVRAIAHPGLVVRRITPDVIRYVIAPACGIDANEEEAVRLYRGLASEGTLVVDEGDYLRHRQDVRAQTLSLMYKDRHEVIQDIHNRAASYWKSLPSSSPLERAEEIYHRLCLGEPFEVIERLWIPEAASSLRSAVNELPDRAAKMLRVLLGDVSQDLDEGATSAEHRAAARAKAAQYLQRDEPSAALAVLSTFPAVGHVDIASIFLKAEALRQLFRWTEAADTLARVPKEQLTSYLIASHIRCEILFGIGKLKEATVLATAGFDLASKLEMTLEKFEFTLMLLACARYRNDGPAVDQLVQAAAVSFMALSDADRRGHPQVLRRYASLAGDSDYRAVSAFFRDVELSALSGAEKAALAQSLADWDRAASKRVAEPAGTLARSVGIHKTELDELDLTWARYVEGASPESLAQLLPSLLARAELKGQDAMAFAKLIHFRFPEWRQEASRALREAYPVASDLTELAARTLSASAAELPVRDRAEEPATALVRWADTEGLLPLLLREAHALRPFAGLNLVSDALDRWVRASGWPGSTADPAVAQSDPPRRTAAPGIDLFELVKRFYEVPFVKRLRIAEELGLIDRSERQLEVGLLCRLILQRAKEKGLLSAIAERLAA